MRSGATVTVASLQAYDVGIVSVAVGRCFKVRSRIKAKCTTGGVDAKARRIATGINRVAQGVAIRVACSSGIDSAKAVLSKRSRCAGSEYRSRVGRAATAAAAAAAAAVRNF